MKINEQRNGVPSVTFSNGALKLGDLDFEGPGSLAFLLRTNCDRLVLGMVILRDLFKVSVTSNDRG